MRKTFDKKSGAIIFNHTKEELEQAKLLREAKENKNKLNALCKILGVSEEDLDAALHSENN